MSCFVRRALHLVVVLLVLFGTLLPLADPVFAQDSAEPTAQATDPAAPAANAEETATATPTETASAAPPEATEVATATNQPPPSATTTRVAKKTPPPAATKKATDVPSPTAKPVEQSSEPRVAAVSPTISLSKTKGAVGTSITVSINDFPAATSLTVTWDGAKLGTVKTNSGGDASYVFAAPESVAGSHSVRVAMSGRSRSSSFTISPRIRVSPSSGAPGKSVTVSLTGFSASEQIALLWGSSTLKSVNASAKGSWSGSVTVPGSPSSGSVTVKGSGDGGHAPTTTFTVNAATSTPVSDPGTLVVKLVDDGNLAVTGACFTVYRNANGAHGDMLGQACDSEDGTDGTTTFASVASGSVLIAESTVPSGFLPGADVATTVTAAKTKTVTVTNLRNNGLTVVKTDEGGAPLAGACFAAYTSIGNGNLGDLKASACDSDDDEDDGVVRLGDLDSGSYVLVEKVVPKGYARAPKQTVSFTAGGSKVVTVQDALGGAVIATVVNEAGDPVVGACFDAYVDLGGGSLGNFVDRACDDSDNVVTIDGLPVGNYYLVESHPPAGYAAAANTKFVIVAKNETQLSIVDLPTTKVVIRKMDEQAQKLVGACFSVYKAVSGGRGKNVYDEKCDGSDGANDGYLTLPLSPGNYLLAETKAPKGYLIHADIAFKIKTGLDTDLDVADELGGVAEITDIDQVEPWYVPTGACFTVWNKKAGTRTRLGTACDNADGAKDGVTRVIGLPTGTWYLEQTTIPWGYFDSPGFTISITAGETTDVSFYNEHWPLLIIHKVDENGEPLGGACFTAFVDEGGGQRGTEWRSPNGPLCDKDEDGELEAWVTPGNQILVETQSPLGYLPIADTPFVMARGEVTELTVQDFQVGLITIHKTDLEGKTQTGACFEAYHEVDGKRGALAGTGCDKTNGDDTYNKSLDGDTIINGLEPGDYLIAEKTPPKGYFPAEDTEVTIETAENEVTIADEPWPAITITKVDDNGDPVKGACFRLYKVKDGARGAAYGQPACGKLNNTIIIGAEPGSYILAESTTPSGFITAKDVTVTYKRGNDTSMTIVDMPAGLVEINNVNESSKPLPGACWQLLTDQNGKPGSKVVSKCAIGTKSTVTLEAKPGKYWLRQSTVPEGYKPAPDRGVTLVARETLQLTIKNTPYPRLVITSVDSANHTLAGACFDLYVDGGTKLGAKVESKLCDKADGANDGSTTRRLEPGRYVAREVTAPEGYVLADDIKFTIVADTDLVLKLSHKLAGVLLIDTQDRAALVLTGACYELWTKLANGSKGVLVAKACDKVTNDATTKLDGETRLAGLPAGTYILSESFAPFGYAKAADQTVTVVAGQVTTIEVINDES